MNRKYEDDLRRIKALFDKRYDQAHIKYKLRIDEIRKQYGKDLAKVNKKHAGKTEEA